MKTLMSLFIFGLLSLGPIAETASCAGWPERTVRIITPFSPGISVDVAARTLGDALAKRWKQSVVVENRPGADTMLGTQAFRDARDDHVLLFTTHSTFTVMPLLHAKVPYDPIGDVKPISLVVEDFLGLWSRPSWRSARSRNWLSKRAKRPGSSISMPLRVLLISLT